VALLFKKIMKTSTEWLFEKLWDEPKDKLTWYAILQQAKEMHREEIINSFFEGAYDGDNISGEQYYTETFKNK
jgi:hypothetical protein